MRCGDRREVVETGLVGGYGVLARQHRLHHRLGAALVPVQSSQHPVVHGGKHLLLVLELHLCLCGVDVHVHGVGPHGEVEHTARELAHHLLVAVGLLQGRHHHPAFDVPSVDEKVLIAAAAPATGGQGDKAGDLHVLPGPLHRQKAQGQIPAQHGVNGTFQLSVSGGEQLLLAVPDELHRQLRVGQGQPLHHSEHRRTLGGVFLHEFQPGGGVKKQVPHQHGGTLGASRLLLFHQLSPFQRQGGAQPLALVGEQFHPGHRRNGGQSLTPEAQGADGLQVVLRGDLGGGMAEKGGLALVGGDAAAVVGDADEGHAPVGDLHSDGVGPGVNGVFHQLFHHRGGPLHHLTGGNEVGHMGV